MCGGDAATIDVSRDPSALAEADKIVMPGQGAFRDCSMALDGGWRGALRAAIERGTPYLGICLGLQALFERSDEADASCKGLGLFAGSVKRLFKPVSLSPDRSGAQRKSGAQALLDRSQYLAITGAHRADS
jgi:glutamine amidotransferase